ncbi:transcription factor MYB124-like isoform X2 [Papaver somniferum]|uniref:transcription factor MYB124-like isoform X2 n=1 Tax=Papaver somniferum TaxID=3469 RepID=UPI000E6FDE35|nr:transcription factor MYB124-like isoform X2 [Papaver somniferum]
MKHQETRNLKSKSAKQKERHIVTWTQQEDDILREQISINGTENWAIIANKFKDKTTRQCRRRWYTYLNSDFKKGGWSPEEDMVLCEAQKIFGNRWTEIAKVVSGRTDNAVKNRFTTLCKKRAKHETILKENKSLCTNPNNKRVLFQNGLVTEGTSESIAPLKKMRTNISDVTENCDHEGRLLRLCGTTEAQQLRPPFAVIFPKSHGVDDLPTQQHVSNTISVTSTDGKSNDQATFLKRNDPRITVLMQQAELLSSLAAKVNSEGNNQSLDNAWKELQDFLNRNHKSNQLQSELPDTDFHLEGLKELIEDLRSNTFGGHLHWRQQDLHEESSGSSGNSTESTLQSHSAGEKTELPQGEVCSLYQATGVEPQSITLLESDGTGGEDGFLCSRVANVGAGNNADAGGLEEFHTGTIVTQVELLASSTEPKGTDQLVPAMSNAEFSSPVKVTPLFRSFGAAIPTPLFSESERNFLLKTFGSASSPPNPSSNHSQPPPCKRSLLQSL